MLFAALSAALPERLRCVVVARTRVADTTALVDTGPFAALCKDVTLAIFAHLPLQDRLTVLTAVCKGWRSLRALPEAWTSLHVHAAANNPWYSPPGLARLLQVAPAARAATDVVLDASPKGFSVDAVCRFVKALTHVQQLAIKHKVNAKCLEAIRALHGLRLRSLSLDITLSDQKALHTLLGALGGCPALETLWLSGGLLGCGLLGNVPPGQIALEGGLTGDALRRLGEFVAVSRSQGGSLLRQLSAPVGVTGLSSLSALFPELATLTCLACWCQPPRARRASPPGRRRAAQARATPRSSQRCR
jgi:hypothetical protein